MPVYIPVISDDYEDLREALQKLRLNDASLHFEPETSQALGFGFRCGFLGMLHMEIVQERLEREYDIDLITTAPTVVYEILDTHGEIILIDNPASLPPANKIAGSSRADHSRQYSSAPGLPRCRDRSVRRQTRCAAQHAVHG